LDSVNITVNIDKTGLPVSKDKQIIKVSSFNGLGSLPDTVVDVYLNGVMDKDKNYYNVVTIGTQTWMAENLKVGTPIISQQNQADNHIIEYYSYENLDSNYVIYGGLYQWDEMMQYQPADNKTIGTTQGVCPDGWHIPTNTEWLTLIYEIEANGGKLKEKGTARWKSPNVGATNEFGFSALPGGFFGWEESDFERKFDSIYYGGNWWSSTKEQSDITIWWNLSSSSSSLQPQTWIGPFGCSVRCVQDQP
jgi:uncharacterized protein (TIGR02145 family)